MRQCVDAGSPWEAPPPADVLEAIRRAGLDPADFRTTRQDGGDPGRRPVP